MSDHPRFEEVLDACIDDIAAGRRSVDQCIEAWPEHRQALAAVLDAASALHELPRVPEWPPDPARRAQFMAEIRSLPQEPLLDAVPARQARRGIGSLLSHARRALPAFGRAGAITVPAAAAAVLAIVLVLGGGSSAHAATLTVFDGAVERADGGAWSALENGSAIEEGDRLRTGADGHALVTFADGSTVALDPRTELTIAELIVDGSRRITLVQVSGRLWHDVAPSAAGDAYTIETPDAVVTAQGTLFETVVMDDGTEVTTAEDIVEVQAGDQRALLHAGEFTSAQARRVLAAVQQRQAEPARQLQLSVEAPFAASLIDQHRRATGVRPDGIVFQQVPSAVTSNPGDGAQQIRVFRPEDGTYELILRRVGEGGGELIVRVGDRVHRIPLDALQDAVHVRLRFASANGGVEITTEVVDATTRETLRDVVERIVVTDLARERAEPIADQLARLRAAAAHDATPTATPSDGTRVQPSSDAITPSATPTVQPASQTPSLSDRFEAALRDAAERCVAGIRAGQLTLAQCRECWSQFGDRLVELVRERLDALGDGDITVQQALRLCLLQIEAGNATPQDCLERWPHHAEQLELLLKEALSGDRDAGSTLGGDADTASGGDAPRSTDPTLTTASGDSLSGLP